MSTCSLRAAEAGFQFCASVAPLEPLAAGVAIRPTASLSGPDGAEKCSEVHSGTIF